MALNDLPARWNRLAALVAAAATGFCGQALAQPPGPPLDLRLVYLGRDIAFVDFASVRRDGDEVSLRVLRVLEADTLIAGETYVGGWQDLRIDCRAKTTSDGAYAALRLGGVVGVPTGRFSTPRSWPGDSVEKAAGQAVCGGRDLGVRAASLGEAIIAGRKALAAKEP